MSHWAHHSKGTRVLLEGCRNIIYTILCVSLEYEDVWLRVTPWQMSTDWDKMMSSNLLHVDLVVWQRFRKLVLEDLPLPYLCVFACVCLDRSGVYLWCHPILMFSRDFYPAFGCLFYGKDEDDVVVPWRVHCGSTAAHAVHLQPTFNLHWSYTEAILAIYPHFSMGVYHKDNDWSYRFLSLLDW